MGVAGKTYQQRRLGDGARQRQRGAPLRRDPHASRSAAQGSRALGLLGEEVLSRLRPSLVEPRAGRRSELPPPRVEGGPRHAHQGQPPEAVARELAGDEGPRGPPQLG